MVSTRRRRRKEPEGDDKAYMQCGIQSINSGQQRRKKDKGKHVEIVSTTTSIKQMASPSDSGASSSRVMLDGTIKMSMTRTSSKSATANGFATSPRSMSPSSLFEYHAEDEFDGDGSFDEYGVRGWLSETSKHLRSVEVPSSASPTKRKAPHNPAHVDAADDVDAVNSPTLSTRGARDKSQARSYTLPSASSLINKPWLIGTTPSSDGSHGGLLSRRRSTNSTAGPSTAVHQHRPATPTSSGRSRASRMLARPQSAMKHRSANEYSSGKNVPVIVVSSGSLPASSSPVDEFNSPEKAKVSPQQRQLPFGRDAARQPALWGGSRGTAKQNEIQTAMSDSDGFSPSPVKAQQAERRVKRARYVLHSRASLPQSSFYQRTKREEGSPTPMSRSASFDLTT